MADRYSILDVINPFGRAAQDRVSYRTGVYENEEERRRLEMEEARRKREREQAAIEAVAGVSGRHVEQDRAAGELANRPPVMPTVEMGPQEPGIQPMENRITPYTPQYAESLGAIAAMKPEDRQAQRYGETATATAQYADQPVVQNYMKNIAPQKMSGGGIGSENTRKAKELWDRWQAAKGTDAEQAALDEYIMWKAAGTFYPTSPAGISRAGARAASIESTVRPEKIETAVGMESATRPERVETAQAIETGKRDVGITLSETSAERLGDFGASLAQLKTLSTSFGNPDAPQGPISQIRKFNPYDWQAQAKQQLIATTKQTVGKALEGGVLRAEDERKYDKILPTMGDTYEAATRKSENIVEMLNNAYQAKRDALKSAGYNVDKFGATGGSGAETTDDDIIAKYRKK